LFSDENGKTTVDFTEDVTAKKLVMKPFVGMYLKKQQAAYIADLKKALGILQIHYPLKAIRKTIERYRITDETKAFLQTLREK